MNNKKRLIPFSILLVLLIIFNLSFAWERGTHAFIADKLKKAGGPYNIEEMYGAMAPDVFNYLFTFPRILYRDYLHDQTHHYFLKIQQAVKYGYEKSSAYGFLSHNDNWGADSTAHHASRTLLPNEGYVITKAILLNTFLLTIPEYAAFLGPYPDIAIEICHNIIEAAGDIVLVRYDKTVGAKLMEIAARPKPNMQNLMVRAYAQGLYEFSQLYTSVPLTYEQAEQLIREEENNFRTSCIAYGWLLQQDEAIILENIIEQFKQLAIIYLTAVGIPVPPEALLTVLLQVSITTAIELIKNDYLPEIMATIDFVKKNMVKEIK